MSCLCSQMCSKHSSMLTALFVVTCCVFFSFGWRLKSQSQFSDSHHSFSIHEQPTQTVADMFGSTVSSFSECCFWVNLDVCPQILGRIPCSCKMYFFKYAVYYIQIYMISDTRKIGRNHCDVLQVSCIQNPASSVLRVKILAKVCSSVVYVLYVVFLIMFTGLQQRVKFIFSVVK